ncbi:ankyrin repeat-containing domain protein [Tuber borchii]|uniref:Ankyrin repeat-containing domain protein n=1 Tax=Tuber borchii TaxID=42251 RepID=A0A2T6ZY40_TUBBO|nr:ankyrin repeat-containing domain protein [Tuber borchii]
MCGQTPLFLAASRGHRDVVKVLLGRDDTPLLWSACSRDVEVVKMLLERDDVNPNKPGDNGETPLWWAAHNGHWRVGRTPLQQAIRNVYEYSVVNPSKPGEPSETLA